MPAVVVRCADMPEAAVPSRVVNCAICGADCWLSLYSGESTLALAAKLGDPRIMCEPCLGVLLGEEEP